jgi:hypothetical protein
MNKRKKKKQTTERLSKQVDEPGMNFFSLKDELS